MGPTLVTDSLPAQINSGPLAVLDRARAAIERAQSLDELKEIRNQVEAARHYVKAAKLGKDMADRCADIRLRAERKAGELLREDQRIRPGPKKSHDATNLSDLDVSKSQSSRWQKIANVPEQVFEDYLTAAKSDERQDITAVGLTQYAARQRDPDTVDDPIPPRDGLYRCIVIDPPWPMRKIERTERPNQGVSLDYPALSLEQMAEETWVPVRTHADDDCHLYLWVTHRFLPAGLDLIAAWGFHYQCVMTWRKNVGITPFSWMYDTEHVLFATRGNLPLERKGLRLSFEAPVVGHSVKPDVFYERVTTASPGPRIDMFARRERDGFDVWGNEVTDVI
jgi:N6-adenosine-specific RNA methylase IME4